MIWKKTWLTHMDKRQRDKKWQNLWVPSANMEVRGLSAILQPASRGLSDVLATFLKGLPCQELVCIWPPGLKLKTRRAHLFAFPCDDMEKLQQGQRTGQAQVTTETTCCCLSLARCVFSTIRICLCARWTEFSPWNKMDVDIIFHLSISWFQEYRQHRWNPSSHGLQWVWSVCVHSYLTHCWLCRPPWGLVAELHHPYWLGLFEN